MGEVLPHTALARQDERADNEGTVKVVTASALGAALLAVVALPQQFHGGLARLLDPGDPAIQYYKTPPSNRVSRLAERLNAGRAQLHYDRDHGYLPALLANLDVPVSSQTLVFSKTSFQASRISPRLPRALYHNEDTYVGFVRGGEVLELAVMDPKLGIAFYSLDQGEAARPALRQRGDECLQCHQAAVTAGVPGLMVRSIAPDRSGTPVFPGPSFITDHRSAFKDRWGGWYATGTHGTARHMGNVYVEKGDPADSLDTAAGANVTGLQRLFDAGAYLAPHSDIPSLMVMEHQTRMSNLLTRAAWTYRIDGKVDAAQVEELVRYMLFAGEPILEAPVRGVSSFARDFSRRGVSDKTGRSLWQLDLGRRLLTYPCSYLIYSDAFDQLPTAVKGAIYARLRAALSAVNRDAAHLTAADRRAIREILIATKRDLPDDWRE